MGLVASIVLRWKEESVPRGKCNDNSFTQFSSFVSRIVPPCLVILHDYSARLWIEE